MSTYVNVSELPRDSKSARFAAQSASVYFGQGRRYLIDGEWQAEPPEAFPDATRIAFDSLYAFACARDTCNAWQGIEGLRIEKTRQPDKAYARLAQARETQQPLTLFVPWGIKPNWRNDMAERPRPEMLVLERIAGIQQLLAARKIPSRVLIMPADIYATEVNNFEPGIAQEYMNWLREQTASFGFDMKPWSEIRRENQPRYNQLKNEYSLDALLSDRATRVRLSSAYKTAAKRSGYESPAEQRQAGFDYVSERLCEAAIIDEQYQPIKLSCVAPEKDNVVDAGLPRIYVIPDELRFPWLKGAPDERV